MLTPTLTDRPSTFSDRRDAGRRLAGRLAAYADARPVVVGVAPDGVPVAAEIAHALGAPLETVAIAPLTLGGGPDDRFGVAGEGGIVLFDPDRRERIDASPETVDAVLIDIEDRLERRSEFWHLGRSRQSLRGRDVLLVADVLADERSAAAAACAVRDRGAANVVYVAAKARLAAAVALEDWVDEIVALELVDCEISPADCFEHVTPVPDEVVRGLLQQNHEERRQAKRQRTRCDV